MIKQDGGVLEMGGNGESRFAAIFAGQQGGFPPGGAGPAFWSAGGAQMEWAAAASMTRLAERASPSGRRMRRSRARAESCRERSSPRQSWYTPQQDQGQRRQAPFARQQEEFCASRAPPKQASSMGKI